MSDMRIINRTEVYRGIRKLSKRLTQEQVDSIEAIIKQCEKHGTSKEHTAYILATAWHESRFKVIRETFGKSTAQVVRRLNKAYRSKVGTSRCYWCASPHYFGRSYSQITWKRNYKLFSKLLGIDMVSNPDLALDKDIGAEILVLGMVKGLFTGKKLSNYKTFYSMRRTVNGIDRAKLIASHARTIVKYVSFDAVDVEEAATVVVPSPEPTITPSFDVPVTVESVDVKFDDGTVATFKHKSNKEVENFSYGDIETMHDDMEETFEDYKHGLESTTVLGAIVTGSTIVVPFVAKLFGYELSAEDVVNLGKDGGTVIQALITLFGVYLTITGRNAAKSKIWWFRK